MAHLIRNRMVEADTRAWRGIQERAGLRRDVVCELDQGLSDVG